jgi:hypothetical protein
MTVNLKNKPLIKLNNEQHECLFLKEYNYCRLTILQFGRTRKELVTVSFN